MSPGSDATIHRIPRPQNWPERHVNRVLCGDALQTLRELPDACVALAVTSPPYWNTVDYGVEGQLGQTSYETFLARLLEVWRETYRVLIPNGKLAVVAPLLPVPKRGSRLPHTRELKNLSGDIERSILEHIEGFSLYSLFIWQKQTTTKMFGSYPYPPNLYEDNTIEFINVFVKEGAPPRVPAGAKEPSRVSQAAWRNLTMQVWPMYPEDVRRVGGHPCPFPVALPQRLILMYTFKRAPQAGFAGDLVLDMFCGTGATCVAARVTGRNFIGIDLHPGYCRIARRRAAGEAVPAGRIWLPPVTVRRARNRPFPHGSGRHILPAGTGD